MKSKVKRKLPFFLLRCCLDMGGACVLHVCHMLLTPCSFVFRFVISMKITDFVLR